MEKQMKKAGMIISILMGLSMSFVLSLVGNLTAESGFVLPAWLISFVVSAIISLVIGFIIPMKKLNDSLCGKMNVKAESLPGNLITSFVSDLIYTPFITLVMIILAYSHIPEGHKPPFAMMYLKALGLSFIVGYVVIAILQPLFVKLVIKNMTPKN